MRRTILMTAVVLTAFTGCHNTEKEQRIQQYEQQLAEERQSKGNLKLALGLTVAGSVILLFVGAAMGSKTRRDGNP